MTTRLVVAVALTLLLGVLTVQLSNFMRDTDNARIALIAETESYATRSKLVRNVDAMLAALRDAHDYWAANATLPPDQWAIYQGADLERFAGLVRILWVDAGGQPRHLRTAGTPALNLPLREEDAGAAEVMRAAGAGVDSEAMLATAADGGDHRVRVVINRGRTGGYLVADIDTRALFGAFLEDESPGYALAVEWRDQTLYERDTPASDIPADWQRDGLIQTSMQSLLRVVHTPTADLAEALITPALMAVIPLGFAVSGLLGLLVYENGRVNVKADAARKAEAEIAKLNRGLEGQVAARTRELADRNADLVTLTESVTHDLRNPLNSISVNLDLLAGRMDSRLDDETRDALGRLGSGVRQMSEIIERVVGLSTAAYATFERKPLAMEKLVEDIFERLHAAEPPPPVTLETGELPDAEADERLVGILVLNLLSNALRHTRGQDARHISVTGHRTESGVTAYCVRDNGRGIDPAQARRIFEPFEHLDDEDDEPRSGGLGLGLTIAARAVKRHGGRIWAEGTRGSEAAIHFTLEPEDDGRRDA